MADTSRLGRWGERYAAAFLEQRGMAVLDQNWRCRAGEIDLIMKEGETVVFVEVKTRRGTRLGAPENAMHEARVAQLFRVIEHYLHAHEIDEDSDWRLDMVGVELTGKGKLVRCEHYRGLEADW